MFEDDDETIEIWKSLGVAEDHISRLGEDDNFWRAGPTGPCGPCSEIYFDQGPEVGCGSPDCKPGCDCDRFLEYWNCVFTQYDGQEDGTLAPLKTKNIDTGMGLERMAAIMQGVTNNYDTDVLRSLVGVGERLAGVEYGKDEVADLCLRIMADHSRSVTFMIADGILPSNEGRGYVLRRLLRRAVMKGHMLGLDKPFLNEYVDELVQAHGQRVPRDHRQPRAHPRRHLVRGGALRRQPAPGPARSCPRPSTSLRAPRFPASRRSRCMTPTVSPWRSRASCASERGVVVDMEGFERCMEAQRDRARAANVKDAEAAWSTYGGIHAELLKELGATKFVGYQELSSQATVSALIADGERVSELQAGQTGEAVLDVTPFYAEMGGEVGDTGVIEAEGVKVQVVDTKAPEKGLVCHVVKVLEGALSQGAAVTASVDADRRARVTRNHTATHILHAALRQVLGEHVSQAGSYVGPDRLRFDFTHFAAVTAEQLAQVERVANEFIMSATPTNIYETSLDAARESGVTALFGEKYGDQVRVVECGGFSRELCGGCHVANTAEIGIMKITSETSVGANVRRIEAVTSYGALDYINKVEAELKETAEELRVPLFDVSERTAANVKQLREFQKKAKQTKGIVSDDNITKLVNSAVKSAAGYPVVISRVKIADAGGLRNGWDVLSARMAEPGACVLIGEKDGKAVLMAAGTPEAVDAGFNAGAVIKAIAPCVQGGGGGKPAMAQAGGKNAAGIDDALEAARKMLL